MAEFVFPLPRDWETFEDIVRDIYSRRYRSDNFQRYGRRGQRQFGVDIAGLTLDGLIGIQCKHRTTSRSITTTEIDAEIADAENFKPPLDKLTIATSSAADTDIQSYVLGLSQERVSNGLFPVEILFWEALVDQLVGYPDLLYKHFTKHFPAEDFEQIIVPHPAAASKQSLAWPVVRETLTSYVELALGDAPRVDPYSLTVGVSSFPHVTFQGQVDIQILLNQLLDGAKPAPDQFITTHQMLTELRDMIQPPQFSERLTVHLQCRLSQALLFGWVFRRVTGFSLQIVSRDEIWVTDGLPSKATGMHDDLPVFLNQESREVAVAIHAAPRSITSSVEEFVSSWQSPPRILLGLSLFGGQIVNAAHALSTAREIATKLKDISDRWRATQIHLFGAMPVGLACLIGYQLNAICPLSLYYLDASRTQYQLAGTITNSM